MKVDPTLTYEEALWEQGSFYVAGIDEAGRGAWAGPVMAGAVILPVDPELPEMLKGARDSKMMTPAQRESMYDVIAQTAQTWAVGSATHEEIDRIGILNATRLAMRRAVEGLTLTPEHLLIDYVYLFGVNIPQTNLKHGDMLSLSIACASIMAKVTRDRWMTENADPAYPEYGFARHKGYGTAQHTQALETYGPCPIHRMTFHPISKEPTLF